MKDNNILNQGIRNADLENYIAEEDVKIQQQTSEFATNLALEGKPSHKEDIGRYDQTISSYYAPLRFYADKELQSQEFEILSEQDEQSTKKAQQVNLEEIKKLDGQMKSHSISTNRISITFNPLSVLLVNTSIVLLTLGLSFLDARSFMAGLGENFLMGIIMGTAVAVGLASFAKMTTYILRKWCNTQKQRVIAFSISLSIVIIVTLLIGVFRSKGANLSLEGNSPHTSDFLTILAFIVLNTFIWLVEFLLSFFLLPTKEQKEQKRKRDEHLAKVKKLNVEIKKLKEENKQLEKRLVEIKKTRQQIEYYRGYIKRWIDSLATQTQSLFWTENALFRSDGHSFFNQNTQS